MKPITIKPATLADVPVLAQLVNRAYRGDSSRQGWTTEADLIDGDRIDELLLRAQVANPDGLIFVARTDTTLLGCVYLETRADSLYLGMLTVNPAAQAQGIGKQLLDAADAYARQQGHPAITMTVIGQRTELIAWYGRHGYLPTGRTLPFPKSTRFGVPRQPLTLVILRKVL